MKSHSILLESTHNYSVYNQAKRQQQIDLFTNNTDYICNDLKASPLVRRVVRGGVVLVGVRVARVLAARWRHAVVAAQLLERRRVVPDTH